MEASRRGRGRERAGVSRFERAATNRRRLPQQNLSYRERGVEGAPAFAPRAYPFGGPRRR
jgi:hypothetical protein